MDFFEEERAKIDFDREELSRLIYDGQENLENHRKIVKHFIEDPVLRIDHTFHDLPRDQQLGFNLRRAVRMVQLHKHSDFPKVTNMNIGTLADYSGSVSSAGLHFGMFETVIKFLGTDEQIQEFMPKIETLEFTG